MMKFFKQHPAEKNSALEKKSSSSPLIALSLIGAPRWSGRDFSTASREGVMANAVAYRCVRMIAEGAASIPWLLYEGDHELQTHPLLALLAMPNPQEEGAALFARWYGFLKCAGDSYLEAVSTAEGICELYVLRPDRVSVVADARGWPVAFDYKVDGRTTRLARQSSGFMPVLHSRLFHPLDDHYGLSPLTPAGTALDVHNGGAAWTKALLDNAARPSGALVYKGPDGGTLTDEQFGRLKRELEESYSGASNAGRPMVLEGGLDWRSMGYSPSELDFANSRAVAAREIALAFGIPPMLLGIPGDSTYANYREANLVFWRQTVIPLVARTARELTNWLAPHFGPNLRLTYDIDAIDALALEREAVWNRLTAATFLTINERRAAAGYSPIDGGDRLS
jgi:HK97 family phage portal protein